MATPAAKQRKVSKVTNIHILVNKPEDVAKVVQQLQTVINKNPRKGEEIHLNVKCDVKAEDPVEGADLL